MSTSSRFRFGRLAHGLVLALALVAAVPLGVLSADAKAGGGGSFGSRGGRTFQAPGFTRTAPSGGQPFQRSETPQPGMGGGFNAAPAQPRRFGFGSGLAAGLLGAGLFGLMTGNGFFGGIGGIMSMFGFLVQLALLAGLAFLALRFFRNRALSANPYVRRPAYAGPAPMRGSSTGSGASPGASPSGPVAIQPRDYDAFESTLVDVQTAYGREDVTALGRLATAEMLRHFEQELRDNRLAGVQNLVSDPKLLQGDLAESWREGGTDYATVAMRFSVRDVTVKRGTDSVVTGDPSRSTESTELWTFRRDRGGRWLLSAIQQAA